MTKEQKREYLIGWMNGIYLGGAGAKSRRMYGVGPLEWDDIEFFESKYDGTWRSRGMVDGHIFALLSFEQRKSKDGAAWIDQLHESGQAKLIDLSAEFGEAASKSIQGKDEPEQWASRWADRVLALAGVA